MNELLYILSVTIQQTLFALGYVGIIWLVVTTVQPFLLPRVVLSKGALANHQLLRGFPVEPFLLGQRTFSVGKVTKWQWGLLALILLQVQLVLFSEWFARDLDRTVLVYVIVYLASAVILALREHFESESNGILTNNLRLGGAVMGMIWLTLAVTMWSSHHHIHEISAYGIPFLRSPALAVIFINSLVLTPFFGLAGKTGQIAKLDEFIIFLSKVAWFSWLGALFVGDLSFSGLAVPLVRGVEVCLAILLIGIVRYFLPKLRVDSLTHKLLWINVPVFVISCLSIFWKA